MLLALYRETEATMSAAKSALAENRLDDYHIAQVRTIKLLLAIIEGIDPENSPISRNIYTLCVFMFDEVSKETDEGLKSARKVLRTLRESFEGIRDEAFRLEQTGEIAGIETLHATIAVG